jgi:hypothetical protein
MKHPQLIDRHTSWFKFLLSPHQSKRGPSRGLSALLFEAVYESRRIQAERTLRRYRDRIDQAKCCILRELGEGSEK